MQGCTLWFLTQSIEGKKLVGWTKTYSAILHNFGNNSLDVSNVRDLRRNKFLVNNNVGSTPSIAYLTGFKAQSKLNECDSGEVAPVTKSGSNWQQEALHCIPCGQRYHEEWKNRFFVSEMKLCGIYNTHRVSSFSLVFPLGRFNARIPPSTNFFSTTSISTRKRDVLCIE
jgi:hypothetical protein